VVDERFHSLEELDGVRQAGVLVERRLVHPA
jgi:hypothetical protein